MISGKELSFEAGSIENKFSTMATTGEMDIKAGKQFTNTVGMVYARKESTIESPKIINQDLGKTIRQGGAFASGRCGWGFGRHTWYYSVHKAEIINASEGSIMSFGENVSLNTEHLIVQGASILSGQQVHIDSKAILDLKSIVDNNAEIASNVIDWTASRICGVGVQFFSIREDK